jgi:hypothetical protein
MFSLHNNSVHSPECEICKRLDGRFVWGTVAAAVLEGCGAWGEAVFAGLLYAGCYCDGVRLCLCGTAASNGPFFVHPPDDT